MKTLWPFYIWLGNIHADSEQHHQQGPAHEKSTTKISTIWLVRQHWISQGSKPSIWSSKVVEWVRSSYYNLRTPGLTHLLVISSNESNLSHYTALSKNEWITKDGFSLNCKTKKLHSHHRQCNQSGHRVPVSPHPQELISLFAIAETSL